MDSCAGPTMIVIPEAIPRTDDLQARETDQYRRARKLNRITAAVNSAIQPGVLRRCHHLGSYPRKPLGIQVET